MNLPSTYRYFSAPGSKVYHVIDKTVIWIPGESICGLGISDLDDDIQYKSRPRKLRLCKNCERRQS